MSRPPTGPRAVPRSSAADGGPAPDEATTAYFALLTRTKRRRGLIVGATALFALQEAWAHGPGRRVVLYSSLATADPGDMPFACRFCWSTVRLSERACGACGAPPERQWGPA